MSTLGKRFDRREFVSAVFRVCTILAGAPPAWVAKALAQEGSTGRLIVHSARPEDLETPVHLLTSWLTPNDLFYVRSHFYTPAIQETEWRLRVEGEVERSVSLALNDLKQMRSSTTTRTVTLECAGNGRAFFRPPAFSGERVP